MTKPAWLVAPIAVVVLHRLASVAGATPATATILLLAAATFGTLLGVGLLLQRLGFGFPGLGFVLAGLFWLSAPTLAWPDWTGGSTVDPAPIALDPATTQRDLVVIMVDDYPSSSALLVDHGYDNTEFRLALSDNGFHLPPEAWSNSSDPVLAIAAALSGRYPGSPANEWDRRRLAAMVEGDSPVADLLGDNGYTTTHLGAPSTARTWFRGLGSGDGSVTADRLAEAIDTAAGDRRPDFVFAHLADCDTGDRDAALGDVVAHAACGNRLILAALDGSESGSDDGSGDDALHDTVVVIAGTSGFEVAGDLGANPAGWTRSAIERRLGVFAAIKLAPGCQPPPDDGTVAVIVHHGLACALGVEPNLTAERTVVVKGDPVHPDGELEVKLNVLRSNPPAQGMRTSH